MRVGGDGGDPGEAKVERRDVVAEHLAEREDEPAEATIDVQTDALRQGQIGELIDRVDRAVPVVGGRADQRHRGVVDECGHRRNVDLRGDGIDRRMAHLDAEQMARLVEGRVGGLGFHDVGHAVALGVGALAVREHGVGDAGGATARDQANRHVPGLASHVGVHQVEPHRDDLAFESRGAGCDVALQRVDVAEHREGLAHECVVVLVSAVERP